MLYLEDYLELIDYLPQELRNRFTAMREMDLQVQNAMDSLDERVKRFFQNAKQSSAEHQEQESKSICAEYYKALEDADEKIHTANQIYDLVERYLRRLDQELQKFKIELEADNAGITEVLERRSLALDNAAHLPDVIQASTPSITPSRQGEKRRASSTHHHHPEKKSTDKLHAPEPLIRTNQVTPSALAPPARVASPLSRASSADSVRSNEVLSSQLGLGSQALAAAASQAIAATQQMQQGRRSASLKASYEAIAVQNLANREFILSNKDIGSLTPSSGGHNASSSTPTNQNNTLSSSISALLEAPMATPPSRKSNKKIRLSSQNSSANSAAHHLLDATDIGVGHNLGSEENPPSSGTTTAQTSGTTEWQADPNEPRYCKCNQISYGDMVACDNEGCPFEWFHYACVDITQPPKGKWYCPQCTVSMKRRTKQR